MNPNESIRKRRGTSFYTTHYCEIDTGEYSSVSKSPHLGDCKSFLIKNLGFPESLGYNVGLGHSSSY